MSSRIDRRLAAKSARKGAATHIWSPWEDATHLVDAHGRRYGNVADCAKALLNNVYSVQVYVRTTKWGACRQLTVRRHDASADIPWRDLQRIKSELMGAERVGVEVFPAESELMDAANLRHIFVFPEGFDFPFTIQGRWT